MAEQLNGRDARYVQRCYNNFKRSQTVYRKTGPFSPDEDALITARVKSGQGATGLWVALAQELGGRDPQQVRKRWTDTLSKRL